MFIKIPMNFQGNKHFKKNYFCLPKTGGTTNKKDGLKILMYHKKGKALGENAEKLSKLLNLAKHFKNEWLQWV